MTEQEAIEAAIEEGCTFDALAAGWRAYDADPNHELALDRAIASAADKGFALGVQYGRELAAQAIRDEVRKAIRELGLRNEAMMISSLTAERLARGTSGQESGDE